MLAQADAEWVSVNVRGNVPNSSIASRFGFQDSGCGSIEADIEPLHCRIKRSLP